MSKTRSKLSVGDSVWTINQMYFVEASHPEKGDDIEVQFPRRHHLKVCGVNEVDNTVDVSLPNGYVATLDRADVDGVDERTEIGE